MAGFLTNLGLAAGRNLLYGQDYEEKQADIAYKKQQNAMGQIALQNAQRQQQTAQTVGAFLQSEAAKDQTNITDPVKSAQMYEKGAGMFLQNGDLAGAEEMSRLAQGKLTEAKEAAVTQAQQKHVKDEAFATAADDYASNPTADGYRAMAQKAVEAGRNPSEIPMPGTPQMATYLNNATKAGMDSKSRAELAEKAYEQDENRKARIEAHKDHEADVQAQRQQTAQLRESMLGIREQELRDREADRAERKADREAKLNAPPKETANDRNTTKAIIASASEGVRGLHVIGALDSDQTAGPFAGLHDGTILDSVAKTGTNALTTDDAQIYHTAAAGMGLEVSRALTLGGGRGANQATINEMQNIIEAHPGDSKATALFKYANAADIIRNRLESMTPPQDSVQEANRQKILKDLSKIPPPSDIIKAVKNPKERAKMLAAQGSMSDVQEKMATESGTGLPGAPDTGAGTNKPPVPSDIQSLVDKYRSK